MVKQADVTILIEPDIAQAAKQVIEGLISVTCFVQFCDKHGFIVSSINVVTNIVTLCCDIGEIDEETNLPIVVWKDITVS